MESLSEKILYTSRWLLAPIYLGLSFGLLLLGLKFFQEVFHVLPLVFSTKEADLVLLILSLIDLSLVGGLIVMVMFSGYENFVSRIYVVVICWLSIDGASPFYGSFRITLGYHVPHIQAHL